MSSTRSQPLLGDTSDASSSSFSSLREDGKLVDAHTSTAVSRRRRNFLIACLIVTSILALTVVLSLYFLLARREPEHIDPPYVEPAIPDLTCPNATSPAMCLRDLYLPYYNLAAYIIPSTDAHSSEYVAECDKRRQFISGFTGSAGTAIVVAVPGVLSRVFTDSRYYLQADQQLNASEWDWNRPTYAPASQLQWINATIPRHSYVGIDPTLIPASSFQSQAAILALSNITLVAVHQNLVDLVWKNRPAAPATPLMRLAFEYTGEETGSKLQRIRAAMAQQRAGALILSALDSIAWMTNLRADDIAYNPMFFSYLLVTLSNATLFVNSDRNGTQPAVWEYLASNNVAVRPYHTFIQHLPLLDAELTPTKRVWMTRPTQAVYGGFSAANVYDVASPVDYMKARKNAVEQQAMRNAHLKESAVFVRTWDWLEQRLAAGATDITECTVADKFFEFRQKYAGFLELSYETIAGSGTNGAFPHYDPTGICSSVNSSAVLLVDSGGQWLNGTTDTTRTVHFGTPTQFEKTTFTLVLMGHIDLINNVWSNGSSPTDWSARQPLLRAGLSYGHGTSHGVGDLLSVHETIGGPVVGGVVTSVEPAYYHVASDNPLNKTVPGYDKGFGIRIETDCVVVPHRAWYAPNNAYWTYEPIAFVPISTNMLRLEMMSDFQIDWLNWYHQRCRELVSPLVDGSARQWLIDNTQPVNKTSTQTGSGWMMREEL